MGMYFGLEAECGSEPHARAVAEHFNGLLLELSDGLKLSCRSQAWQDVESSW